MALELSNKVWLSKRVGSAREFPPPPHPELYSSNNSPQDPFSAKVFNIFAGKSFLKRLYSHLPIGSSFMIFDCSSGTLGWPRIMRYYRQGQNRGVLGFRHRWVPPYPALAVLPKCKLLRTRLSSATLPWVNRRGRKDAKIDSTAQYAPRMGFSGLLLQWVDHHRYRRHLPFSLLLSCLGANGMTGSQNQGRGPELYLPTLSSALLLLCT